MAVTTNKPSVLRTYAILLLTLTSRVFQGRALAILSSLWVSSKLLLIWENEDKKLRWVRSQIRALTRTLLRLQYLIPFIAPCIPIGLRLEVCPSGGVIERANMKARTEIRRADKIEFEKRSLVHRKFFVFNILGSKNIYRFSRESRELG